MDCVTSPYFRSASAVDDNDEVGQIVALFRLRCFSLEGEEQKIGPHSPQIVLRTEVHAGARHVGHDLNTRPSDEQWTCEMMRTWLQDADEDVDVDVEVDAADKTGRWKQDPRTFPAKTGCLINI